MVKSGCKNAKLFFAEPYASNSGKECWMVAGHIVTKLQKCPKILNEFKNCHECPWFKKPHEKVDNKKEHNALKAIKPASL